MRYFYFLGVLVSVLPSIVLASSGVDYRNESRSWVRSHADNDNNAESPFPNDLARNLVDKFSFDNLEAMEKNHLMNANLMDSPWSGSYWPTYEGQIANRYGDDNYNPAISWKDNAKYLESKIGQGSNKELSPAEKYDLLVGDENFTLTKKMILAGQPYSETDGNVETWFGLCHGWAPAAFMLPRPFHSITVKAADGRDLKFNPTDIKALGTLLWANAPSPTKFIGGRCNNKDIGNTEPNCRDTNPATWHLSVVNQIGVSKRSFVMDATANYEVWNQPINGYRYVYGNPITKKVSYRLQEAKVKLADYKEDPYRAKRAAGTVYVVNVSMNLDYIEETQPSLLDRDSSAEDAHHRSTYSYDLELDEKDQIIGGEWHSQEHPDFLWVPKKDAKANSRGDVWLDSRDDRSQWDGKSAIPAVWQSAAKFSSYSDQPLARVVEKLFELSNN